MEEELNMWKEEAYRLQGICRKKDERIEELTRINDELAKRNERLNHNMGVCRNRLVYLITNEILPLGD